MGAESCRPRIENAFFLVGSERSGSTLLSIMLDHHPTIAWSRGFEYAVELLRETNRWPPLSDYYRFLETDRVFQTSGGRIDRTLSYPELIHDFLRQERDDDGKRLVGATVHFHFDRLRRIFPACRFIHLLRDGREVSRSCVDQGWAGNAWSGARRWIDAERLWSRVKGGLQSGEYYEVRYESFIDAPEQTLRALCDFIGVPYSSQMLAYPRDTTYMPPSPDFIDQWKQRLSVRDIRLVESRIGDLLQERGYRLSGLPPLRVGWASRQWLREDDRYRRMRFRIARNGWQLVAADFVARRLRLHPWARRLRLRLNAISTKYLK